MSEKQLETWLNPNRFFRKSKKIHFYVPSFMYYNSKYYNSSPVEFPTISVTGTGCALKCKHCEGKILNTMLPAASPEKLIELCTQLNSKGTLGCLLSGGCLPDGSVPLKQFIPAIKQIKRELNLTIFAHTGLLDTDMAEKLKNAGVDAVLLDIIGSNETIKEIYHLKLKVENYEQVLKALKKVNLNFVPHIIVGLHFGQLKGELYALEMVSKYEPTALVIIAFLPLSGTEMENIEPAKPIDIAKVITIARLMFPKTPLVLGCMRPKGKHRVKTDILALKAGVDAIAFPTEEAIEFAKNQGYNTEFSSFCCSQIYLDILKD
jgi:uncharacterized radical SAM superfamily protein